jgi:UDP-glucuronate decarboxylase
MVVVGAGGWIGRVLLRSLHSALGVDAFSERVFAFGSSKRMIDLGDAISIAQRPLDELACLHPQPTALFHLAFLTKDKVAFIDHDEYRETNRALSSTVLEALSAIGVDRLFVASSGAAAFADDPSANEDLRIYGALKREDEDRFVAWAEADTERRAVVTRIYNLTGPFINKHETYALASFIIDALSGRPISVRAPMQVVRSYVAIRELVSLVLCQLLGSGGVPVCRYDSGGEVLELREVAAEVARVLGGTVVRAPITESVDNNYTGDAETYASLLEAAGIAPVPLDQQILDTAITIAPEPHSR